MTAVTLRCLAGHETVWDPDHEEFPSDGCDLAVGYDPEQRPIFCHMRYGRVDDQGEHIYHAPMTDRPDISDIVSPDVSDKTYDWVCAKGHRYVGNDYDGDNPPNCDYIVEYVRQEPQFCDSPRTPYRPQISEIVSQDAETTTNERGGMQSHVPVRFDLIDGKAMFAMAAVLHEGAEKYAPGNWRLIPTRDHLNHALMHIYAYLSGDRTDDHLSHALCRVTFANAVELDPEAGPERDT